MFGNLPRRKSAPLTHGCHQEKKLSGTRNPPREAITRINAAQEPENATPRSHHKFQRRQGTKTRQYARPHVSESRTQKLPTRGPSHVSTKARNAKPPPQVITRIRRARDAKPPLHGAITRISEGQGGKTAIPRGHHTYQRGPGTRNRHPAGPSHESLGPGARNRRWPERLIDLRTLLVSAPSSGN